MRAPTSGLDGLGDALRIEIQRARARHDHASARRLDLERDLRAAVAAEEAARHAVDALEAVAEKGADVVPGLRDLDLAGVDGRTRLAGGQLRERLARVALRRGAAGKPVHWREWLGWLHEDGFEAAGKKPEATFLTQLSRSPLVGRSAQEGVYVLELELAERNRERLLELHNQLANVPPPDQLALLGDIRARRRELQREITAVERAVEECWRVLAKELPEDSRSGVALSPEWLIEAWRKNGASAG